MDNTKNRIMVDVNLVVCFAIATIISLLFFFKFKDSNINYPDFSFEEGWSYSDGSPVDLGNIVKDQKYVTISKTFSGADTEGADLCFTSTNIFFNIYLDGEIIYSFHPDMELVYGKYYGEYIHVVNLPLAGGVDKVIKIIYEPLLDNSWTGIKDMKIAISSEYYQGILRNNILHFATSAIVFLIGAVLVAAGLIFDRQRYLMTETVSLGVMAIVLAMYSNSGSMFIQLLTDNSAVARIMELYALILLPVPVIIFVASFTGYLDAWPVKIELTLVLINIVTVVAAVLSRRADYHDLLWISHFNIVIGMIFLVVMIVNGIRKRGRLGERYRYLLSAFAVILVAGIGDLVRYYIKNNGNSAGATRVGLVVFVIILSVYEVKNLLRINARSTEAELMDKLAHADGLTGLGNRMAFNEKEQDVKESDKTYSFVQFDVNYLKTVNDNYGHIEGDRHIKAAADSIRESFGRYGSCYRIGGDEFFSIIEDDRDGDRFKEAMESFLNLVEKYNNEEKPPVELKIAWGRAFFDPAADDPETAEKLADTRMYECKRHLKETL